MELLSPRIRSLLRQADRVADAGKRSAAEKLYRQIIEEAPDTAAAWFGLGRVLPGGLVPVQSVPDDRSAAEHAGVHSRHADDGCVGHPGIGRGTDVGELGGDGSDTGRCGVGRHRGQGPLEREAMEAVGVGRVPGVAGRAGAGGGQRVQHRQRLADLDSRSRPQGEDHERDGRADDARPHRRGTGGPGQRGSAAPAGALVRRWQDAAVRHREGHEALP